MSTSRKAPINGCLWAQRASRAQRVQARARAGAGRVAKLAKAARLALGASLALTASLGLFWLAPSPASASAAPSTTQRVTLRFMEYPRPNEGPLFRELVAGFQKLYPYVDIEYEPLDASGAGFTKLTTAMVGGAAPDVVCAWGPTFRRWMEMGLFLDLQPLLSAAQRHEVETDFFPLQLTAFRFGEKGEKLYALPQYLGVLALIYNQDATDEVGIGPLPSDLKWEDFRRIAIKLTKRVGGAGGAQQTERWGFRPHYQVERVAPWVSQNGGRVFSPDGRQVLIDSQQGIAAVQYLADFNHKYRTAPTTEEMAGRTDVQMFADGKLAILADGSWMLNRGILDGGFPVGIAPLPYQVRRSTMGTIDAFAVFHGTKHPKEAVAWLWYLTSPVANELRAKYQSLQPARRSVGLRWAELMREGDPRVAKIRLETFLEAMAYGEPEPIFADQALINSLLAPALRRIIVTGDASAEAELSRVAAQINAQMK